MLSAERLDFLVKIKAIRKRRHTGARIGILMSTVIYTVKENSYKTYLPAISSKYYKAIVPALSMDKASSWPFNEVGDINSPPVSSLPPPLIEVGDILYSL